MNKRGITVTIIIGWAIGILAVFVIIIVLFGPEKLLARTRDAAFSFGLGALPEERVPEFLSEKQIPPNLEEDFETLVTNIRNAINGNADSCLVYMGGLRIDDDWEIKLERNKASIISESIRGGASTPKITVTITDFQPCKIKDRQALNFYENYLREGVKENHVLSFLQEDVTLEEGEKIKYLFKQGDKFCFFESYSDGGGCSRPRNNGRDGIDDDCRSKIPSFVNNLHRCDDLAKGRRQENKRKRLKMQ